MSNYVFITLLLTGVWHCGAGCVNPPPPLQTATSLAQPLERANERPKKLTFGLYVTPDPAQNPIDPPERFIGYHTALDFEIFPEEKDQAVSVYSICPGKVVYKNTVEGYGGTLIQSCVIQGQEVTVLYGHLKPSSMSIEKDAALKAGEKLGVLGAHLSEETSQTRKHLHLGIHKGNRIELRGYVQAKSDLDQYLNPAPLLGY